MLNGCGEGGAYIELRARSGADFNLPDLTKTLDVLIVQFFGLVSELLIVRSQVKNMAVLTSSQESAHLVRFFRLLLKEPVCWLL